MSTPTQHPFDAPLSTYQQQAETVFASLQSGDSDAAWRFKWMHPRFRGKPVTDVTHATVDLDDARLLIAREHYFENWSHLESFTKAVKEDGAVTRFEQTVEAVINGDILALQSFLKLNPELVKERSQRVHHATLLHYLGANGVEGYRQKTPLQAVEVARMLLDAGADADALADLYDHKCTTMSMLVSSSHPAQAGLQVALVETLLDYGASMNGPGTNWQSAVLTALLFGYLQTAEALVQRGAPVDTFVIAAGLGRVNEMHQLLHTADELARHQALALASQLGHYDALAMLLDLGESPDRFNPEGFHSHSTPLHQAVCANHLEVVKLLVQRGARLDLRDGLYDGTALDWAIYSDHDAIVQFLLGMQRQQSK